MDPALIVERPRERSPMEHVIPRLRRAGLAAAALAATGVLVAGCTSAAGTETAPSDSPADGVEIVGVTIDADADARALLPDDIASAGAVKVATDAPYAPF